MNEKILLVDDNQDLLMIARIILKGQGYNAFLAASLEEAQRKIRIHQPSLVLLDVCLTDGDGRDFCAQLKSEQDTNGIRVILMSGHEESAGECLQADGFLQKPFDYNELLEKVSQQLALSNVYH